ncbi:MAG: hypothetical protein ACK5LC_05155 [Coprobacillaceae bacterium]
MYFDEDYRSGYLNTKEKKSITKSMRMTPTTQQLILSWSRTKKDGFNNKLENMIDYLVNEEDNINQAIKDKQMKVKELDNRIKEKMEILNLVNSIQSKLGYVESEIKSIEKIFKK